MKSRLSALLCFDTLIVILIIVAFSLNWIHLGKILNVSGWGLPDLYRKSTNVSNTILFFAKKDSPHLAKFIYIVPILGILSTIFRYYLKRQAARLFLLLTCIFGIIVSLYMYYYFLSSKMFKLSNAGIGIHLLLGISVAGILYIIMYSGKPKNIEVPVQTGDNLTF